MYVNNNRWNEFRAIREISGSFTIIVIYKISNIIPRPTISTAMQCQFQDVSHDFMLIRCKNRLKNKVSQLVSNISSRPRTDGCTCSVVGRESRLLLWCVELYAKHGMHNTQLYAWIGYMDIIRYRYFTGIVYVQQTCGLNTPSYFPLFMFMLRITFK